MSIRQLFIPPCDNKMLLYDDLSKYRLSGSFYFTPDESLENKCNAPADKNGIYLIFNIYNQKEDLLYLGSSGQMRHGILKTRQSGLGGMKDRIVNGYHPKFGKVPRKKAFPEAMKNDKIAQIKIYWWVTYDRDNKDIPTEVESKLRQKVIREDGSLPLWHKRDN